MTSPFGTGRTRRGRIFGLTCSDPILEPSPPPQPPSSSSSSSSPAVVPPILPTPTKSRRGRGRGRFSYDSASLGSSTSTTDNDDTSSVPKEGQQPPQNGKPVKSRDPPQPHPKMTQYDVMMYEAFGSETGNEYRKSTAARYSIMKVPTKKDHNLADIPEISEESQDSTISNLDQPSTVQPMMKPRANSNSLIEARNRFRQALSKARADSVRPKMETQGKDSKRTSRKANSSDFITPKKNNKQQQPPKCVMLRSPTPHKKLHLSDENLGFVLHENLPLYELELEKAKNTGNLFSLGRLWAKEHFPTGMRIPRPSVNQPPAKSRPDFDGPYPVDGTDVWHLPAPEPRPLDPETGEPINLRLPKPIRDHLAHRDRRPRQCQEIQPWPEATAAELLASHMPRWRSVRVMFQRAETENKARYEHSFAVLGRMFDLAWKEDEIRDMAMYKNPPYDTETKAVTSPQESQESQEPRSK